MKKTSNNLRMTKNLKGDFLQTQIPKTAMESKSVEKEYLSAVQKRVISKQLLSQIHFCRFTYKLIIGLQSKLCFEVCQPLKRLLSTLLFSKLSEIKDLKLISKEHL